MRRGIFALRACLTAAVMVAATGVCTAAMDETGGAGARIAFGNEAGVYLEGKKLSLGDAIRLAIESNYDILSGAYDLAMLDSEFRMTQKRYSPFLSAEAGTTYQEFPEATGMLTGTDATTWSASAALAKAFPTGTRIALGLGHERSRTRLAPLDFTLPGLGTVSLPAFGDPDYHQATTFVTVKQDLLRNAFGRNERLELRQTANTALQRKDALLYQLSLVVVKVVMDYWDVVLKESALANARRQHEETVAVRDITAEKVELGVNNRFEIHYYNVLVAGAEAKWRMAEQTYRDARRAFLRAINLDDEAVLEGPAVLVDRLPALDAKNALETAYAHRADYVNAERRLAQAEWEWEIANNLALPELTVELTLNALGQRTDAADAWSDLFAGEQIGYAGKLGLTYPLEDPAQRIRQRNARFARKQAELALRQARRLIQDEIEEQIQRMRTFHRLYRLSRRARLEAEKFYRLMVEQLRRGRLDAATVKNGVDALAEARQLLLVTLIPLNTTHLQTLVPYNTLFETYGIEPDRYIPQ